MKLMPFTDGQWEIEETDDSIFVVEPRDNVIVAVIEKKTLGWIVEEQAKANAALIMASPALFRALSDFVAYLGNGQTPSEVTLIAKAKAAIALARGAALGAVIKRALAGKDEPEDAEGSEDVGRNGWKIDGRGDE